MRRGKERIWWVAAAGGVVGALGLAGSVACSSAVSIPAGDIKGLLLGGLLALAVLVIHD